MVYEVWSFLGLVGYYRHFIEGFSIIALLLTTLTNKAMRFDWTGKECEVFCNASHQGLGCVLI